eukprot:15480643-Alexandrium_andersonii.AAC.1
MPRRRSRRLPVHSPVVPPVFRAPNLPHSVRPTRPSRSARHPFHDRFQRPSVPAPLGRHRR